MNEEIKSFLEAIQKDHKAGGFGYLLLYGTYLDNAFSEGTMHMVKKGICPVTLVYHGEEEVKEINLSTLLASLEKHRHPIIQAMVACKGHEPDDAGISFSITYGKDTHFTLSLGEATLTLSSEKLLKMLKKYPLPL